MIIVNGQNIKKYHSAHLVLDGVTFEIHDGEKVGLIGRNASGKSTLLQLISGHLYADEGILTLKKNMQVGYLPQIPAEFESMMVYEVLAYGYRELTVYQKNMFTIEQEMSNLEATSKPERLEQLLKSYADVQERFERGGGYEMDVRIDQVTGGLKIPKSVYERSFGTLSGGEKTRIALASQLIIRPDLLLLDEPTNHLDLKGIEWLEQFLQGYTGACIVVSHDRYFLDQVASKMIELEDGEAHMYSANYSGYMKEKEERLLQQFAQYQEQQKVIKKMKETIRQLEEWGRVGGNEKFFKRAASMRKALERLQAVKRPVLEPKSADFELVPLDRSGRRVVTFEGISKAYGNLKVLSGVEGNLEYGEKVILLGDNGSGKTTLFKLLIGEDTPDRGKVELGTRVEIGYLAQHDTIQDRKQTVLDYFRMEGSVEEGEARGILAKYLFYGADVFKPVSMLSGGEWSRLRLALLVRKKPNLLLLDEPTNHLDIGSREALEEALEEFPGTVLAISHDRYFINRLAQRVWELEQGKIVIYLGNFDNYRAKKRQLGEVCVRDAAPPEGNGSIGGTRQYDGNGAPTESKLDRLGAERVTERRRQQFEGQIAALEADLAAADEQIERLSGSGETVQLEVMWREREVLQERLDALLEAWIKLV